MNADTSSRPASRIQKAVVAVLLAAVVTICAILLCVARPLLNPEVNSPRFPSSIDDLWVVPPMEGFEPGDLCDIAEGDCELAQLLAFLSSYTGMPVLANKWVLKSRSPITIVAPIIGTDAEIVKALVEAHRMEIQQKKTDDGRVVLVLYPH